MDDKMLAEIEVRAGDATPGPWEAPESHPHGIIVRTATRCIVEGAGYLRWNDAAFIAAARFDVPRLVAEVRRLRAENATARREGSTAMRDAILFGPHHLMLSAYQEGRIAEIALPLDAPSGQRGDDAGGES